MKLFVLPSHKYHLASELVADHANCEQGLSATKWRIEEALIKEANVLAPEDLVPGCEYNTIGIVQEPGKGYLYQSRLVIHANWYWPEYNSRAICAKTAWGGLHETRLRDGMLLLQK